MSSRALDPEIWVIIVISPKLEWTPAAAFLKRIDESTKQERQSMKNSDTARFTVAGIAVLSIFVASSSSVLSQELINQKALPVDMALAIAQGAVEQCRAD